MAEVKLSGNHLKGSRPVLSFHAVSRLPFSSSAAHHSKQPVISTHWYIYGCYCNGWAALLVTKQHISMPSVYVGKGNVLMSADAIAGI